MWLSSWTALCMCVLLLPCVNVPAVMTEKLATSSFLSSRSTSRDEPSGNVDISGCTETFDKATVNPLPITLKHALIFWTFPLCDSEIDRLEQTEGEIQEDRDTASDRMLNSMFMPVWQTCTYSNLLLFDSRISTSTSKLVFHCLRQIAIWKCSFATSKYQNKCEICDVSEGKHCTVAGNWN